MDKVIQGLSFAIIFIVTFMGVSFIYTFIHELGHAIAMILVGFKVSRFIVFPFKIYQSNEGYKCAIDIRIGKKYLGNVQPSVSGIHTDTIYDKLLWKVCLVLGGGHILELMGMILFLLMYQHLPEGYFKLGVEVCTWTMFLLSFLSSIDLPGIYKVCTDNISKEICIYDWVVGDNIIDTKSVEIVTKRLLDKYEYINNNTKNLKESTLLEYYNIILDLALSEKVKDVPKIDFLEPIYHEPELINRKSGALKNAYIAILHKYLRYLYINEKGEARIEEVYQYLDNQFVDKNYR